MVSAAPVPHIEPAPADDSEGTTAPPSETASQPYEASSAASQGPGIEIMQGTSLEPVTEGEATSGGYQGQETAESEAPEAGETTTAAASEAPAVGEGRSIRKISSGEMLCRKCKSNTPLAILCNSEHEIKIKK